MYRSYAHWLFWTIFITGICSSLELEGPTFVVEPPYTVEFYNTKGTQIPCTARGKPTPHITWLRRAGGTVIDIPGLRQVRPNGSLVFLAFNADDYRPDIHTAVYRCIATNILGTIGSRDVHVRAVLAQQYEIRVYDEFVIRDNTAVLKCSIPSFVRDFVTVKSWYREDGLVIQSDGIQGGKYSVFPSGTLHIRDVTQQDGFRDYRCQTNHRVTGETKQSAAGQLIVTEPHNSVPPRITHREEEVKCRRGQMALLPCAAEGFPVPTYLWYQQKAGRLQPLRLGQRFHQMGGTLVIRRTIVEDSGKYVCLVNNSVGQERLETQLIVMAPLSVRITPSQQLVAVGHSAMFNCTVEGHPVLGVAWTKNVRPLVTNQRVKLMSSNILSITTIERGDKGIYQCFAHNKFDSAQASAQLFLGDEPPTLEETFSERTVQPGSSVSLKCMATGSPLPQLTWTLDGFLLPEFLRYRVGDYVTRDSRVISYVNITSVRPEDGGLFMCVAKNDVGSSAHSSRLNVFGPPSIRPMSNITALAGTTLIIHCPAGGYPLSSITWERDNRQLPQSHRQNVYPNGTLIIQEVNKKGDEGKYTCIAYNKLGVKAQRDLFVEVMVGPKIEPFSFPRNLEEGMRSIVICAVLYGDPPIAINWLKDGEELGAELNARIEMINDFTSSVTFNSIGPHHNGNYTCVARNAAAVVNHTALMVVSVPPFWKSEPSDKEAIMGESIMIDCQANGFPSPQVRWKKFQGETAGDFRTVISNPHIQTLENGSLVITEVELADDGQYMCQATNGVGPSLSSVVRLIVHVPAHFRNKFKSTTIRKDETVQLKCEAYGERPLTISWMKDRQNFNPRSDPRYSDKETILEKGMTSELTIISANRRDSALFTCTAANEYGKDETNFQVLVQEKPDSPRNVEVKDVTSRTVTVSWVHAYTGNLPLINYIVQVKRQDEQWTDKTKSMSVVNSETAAVVRNLNPVTTYNFRVIAENSLGKSNPSDTVSATTSEEAPSAPPVDIQLEPLTSTSFKITWLPPPEDSRQGSIKGYYLGYKIQRSGEEYVYKTLETSANQKQEYILNNLRRSTQYAIKLQAFNKAGPGPASDDVLGQTLEFDPPSAPIIKSVSASATTVHLKWEIEDNIPITGYILKYKEDKSDWNEHPLPPEDSSYILEQLRCGTRYQIQLTAYNNAGHGEQSDTLNVKTEGTAPVAPDKYSFLSINSTYVILYLSAWQNGGCPILSFIVQYKQQSDSEWFLVSNNVLPERGVLMLPDLNPATRYNLLMTAHNDAGSTDAEYVFATLTLTGATIPPLIPQIGTDRRLYKHLSIIVPVVCAVVIVIVVTIVICVLHTKRHQPNRVRGPHDQGDNQCRQVQKGDTLSMTVMGKKPHGGTTYEVPKDFVYFPSPYATTRVPGCPIDDVSECDSLHSSRTPSEPHGSHTYDVPFPVRKTEPEEQYSRIKRVPVPSVPTKNEYQLPQFPEYDKRVNHWLYQRSRPISEPGYPSQVPSPYVSRWSAGYRLTSKERQISTIPCDNEGMCFTEEESDLEHIHSKQDDDEDGHEISEAECDREIKEFTGKKCDKGLRVAMPPECIQHVANPVAVH
ncbi:Down syndrome cell adhesion molecule-like protein Dscam2 [Centruroides sculpturatus]|uniref:Down syndrome cell adhesion molecule-like protein Dscam2 n=1 Tax=Centruroides sculpturatus TaxID=218467 RepID=UPI000C6DBDFD|nr:Down syndrome cell adhesion molecule-like protein Dscam2 [Centruroides sculpturatus]